jgi:hypothetical protein
MRPQALLGQMMWYAIYMIRYTHHSEWEKLIAAEIASMENQWIAKHDDSGS